MEQMSIKLLPAMGTRPCSVCMPPGRNKKKELDHHKRQMAIVLTQVCGATVPYDDRNGSPSDIQEWLVRKPKLNLEVLE